MTRKLDDIEKKQIFNVPDGYFKSLPDQILSKVDQKEAKTIYFSPILKWSASIAATIALIIAVSIFTNQPSTVPEIAFDEFTDEQLVDYLIESQGTVDLLAEAVLTTDDWEEMVSEADDISAYLMEEDLLNDILIVDSDSLTIDVFN